MENDDLVQFNVYIPRNVLEKFRNMIAMKHQSFRRGLLSTEVKEALLSWIALNNTHAQGTHEEPKYQMVNPIPTIRKLKMDICNYLTEVKQYQEVPQFIPDKFLIEGISSLKGTDNRTVKKYVKLLQQYGCIKQVGVHQWEIT